MTTPATDTGQTPETPPATAQSRYEQLTTERSGYLRRAQDAAKLTIPSLIPPDGNSGVTSLPAPWQSVGARGVNNLAAKLLLALLPPGSAFFKLTASAAIMDELKQSGNPDVVAEMEAALSKVEKAVTQKIEASNARSSLHETFKHLIVGGNALLYVMKDGQFKFFPLSKYVVKRDTEGNVLEIVVKESFSRQSLPLEVRQVVETMPDDTSTDPTKAIDLYTRIVRAATGSWRIHQEVQGQVIEATRGVYPAGKNAWIPLRWTEVANEDYGRGHIEEYFGDLYSLESLSQSLVDGAAAMAKIVMLVDEAGVTSRKKIAEAPNLAVLDGNAKDVTVLGIDKSMDFSVAQRQAQEIEQRLAQAFLLNSSIQRDAERVTAEEIRIMAGELETGLGGVYSLFANELQRPLVERYLQILKTLREIPALPDKSILPQIVTGLDGLGRTSDLTKLDLFLAGLGQLFGPPAVSEYVNIGNYAKRRAAALAIDTEGLIRSEDEVQATRQQAQQAQMAQSLGPQAIKAQADRDVAATKQAEQPAAPQ